MQLLIDWANQRKTTGQTIGCDYQIVNVNPQRNALFLLLKRAEAKEREVEVIIDATAEPEGYRSDEQKIPVSPKPPLYALRFGRLLGNDKAPLPKKGVRVRYNTEKEVIVALEQMTC